MGVNDGAGGTCGPVHSRRRFGVRSAGMSLISCKDRSFVPRLTMNHCHDRQTLMPGHVLTSPSRPFIFSSLSTVSRRIR